MMEEDDGLLTRGCVEGFGGGVANTWSVRSFLGMRVMDRSG